MKIAIYQGPGIPLDVAANLDTLSLQAERAARESARLLIAPEMILSGYNRSHRRPCGHQRSHVR